MPLYSLVCTFKKKNQGGYLSCCIVGPDENPGGGMDAIKSNHMNPWRPSRRSSSGAMEAIVKYARPYFFHPL